MLAARRGAGYAPGLPFWPSRSFQGPFRNTSVFSMARSRIKSGGPTRGRLRVLKMGMGSGKVLAKGRVKKPKRGKGRG